MNKAFYILGRVATLATAVLLFAGNDDAKAAIAGITGPSFNLTAKSGQISSADGGTIFVWGYANGAGPMQYPGPTLIVNQGDTVTVSLTNQLSVPVSLIFPGQGEVTAAGGSAGLLTQESNGPADTVTYSFQALNAGTYLYHSGTRPDLQVEMGLVGALIVRPAGFDELSNRTAYGHPDSGYDHENLFLLTEIDAVIHDLVEFGRMAEVDTTTFHSVYWFINGRAAPDTLDTDGAPWLPHQPYSSLTRAHPCEKVLMRVIGAGRELHPLHHHGANATVIARDGRLLESAPGAGPDLGYSDFTIQTNPGGTYDAIYEWTGANLGWDIYGHAPGDALETCEFAADHGKEFPVLLPGLQDMTFGGFYSGSPFLGSNAALPVGEGGMNLNDGLFFMWHSHTEKELVNFDVFPGGMMTMFILEAPGVPIP